MKFSFRTVLQKLLPSVLIFSGACALLLPTFQVSSQQAPQRHRIIDDKYSYSDCPIKIVGIETNRHPVTLKESFSDDDDWLRGLTIRIENTSGRVLTHVGIAIHFDRPPDQADPTGALWELSYGISPFSFKPNAPIPATQVRLIQPGEKVSIALSDVEYDALKSFLNDIKLPLSLERIHISVYTIGFADGTAWGGRQYRRDPRAPNGWAPVEKPPGSVRNRAAFSYSFAFISYKKSKLSGWNISEGRTTDITFPMTVSPEPDVQCGSAFVATPNCPNQPFNCYYNYITELNTISADNSGHKPAGLIRDLTVQG